MKLPFDDLKVTDAIIETFKMISATNKYIDNTKPWELAKETDKTALSSVMNHLANNLYIAAFTLITDSDKSTKRVVCATWSRKQFTTKIRLP